MLRICASNSEIEISGTPVELRTVCQFVAASEPGARQHVVADSHASPAPYDRLLSVLEVAPDDGLVRITIDGEKLRVTGATERLKRLAAFFDFADDSPAGYHCHYEYWEGHMDIAPESLPLVIARA